MSESNPNPNLNPNPMPSTSATSATQTTEQGEVETEAEIEAEIEIEPVEEEEENPEQAPIIHPFPFPPQVFPLDLRKRKGQTSNLPSTSATEPGTSTSAAASTSTSSAVTTGILNGMLSDTNPLCSQFYLQAINYQGKFRRLTPSLQSPRAGEDVTSERLARQRQRNRLAQRVRDAERYRQCFISVRVIQMMAQNAALRAKIRALMEEINQLRQLLRNAGQRQ